MFAADQASKMVIFVLFNTFLRITTESGIEMAFKVSELFADVSTKVFEVVSFEVVPLVSIKTTCEMLCKEIRQIKQSNVNCFIDLKVKRENIVALDLVNIYKTLEFREFWAYEYALFKIFTFVILLKKTCCHFDEIIQIAPFLTKWSKKQKKI